jgi:hypothetical protein
MKLLVLVGATKGALKGEGRGEFILRFTQS